MGIVAETLIPASWRGGCISWETQPPLFFADFLLLPILRFYQMDVAVPDF